MLSHDSFGAEVLESLRWLLDSATESSALAEHRADAVILLELAAKLCAHAGYGVCVASLSEHAKIDNSAVRMRMSVLVALGVARTVPGRRDAWCVHTTQALANLVPHLDDALNRLVSD